MRGFIFLSGLLTIALWGTSVLAQSSVLVTSGMGSGASSTARLSAILQQQVSKVNQIEACGNNGKIYGKSFPLVDVNDCIATFSTSSSGDTSLVQLLDFVTARHIAPSSGPHTRDITINGDTVVSGTLTASGEVIINDPTDDTHATTKSYVDSAIAASSSSGGGGGACYYTDSSACSAGFSLAPGLAKQGVETTATHKICCTGIPKDGAFVLLSATGYTGNMGGLAGANATCLAGLQSSDWMNKPTEALTADKVKAFMCDDTTCQKLLPNNRYAFAQAGLPAAGGETFFVGADGLPPQGSWTPLERFNNGYNMWTGVTAAGSAAVGKTCSNWTSSSAGVLGKMGNAGAGTAAWDNMDQTCNDPSGRIICVVNP